MMATESAKIDMIMETLHSPNLLAIIDGLRPNSTFRYNPSTDHIIDIYLENPKEFVSLLKESLYRTISEKRGDVDLVRSAFSDLRIKLITEEIISMHNITSKHENTTITFDCQIIATDSPKTYVKEAKFICPVCSDQYNVKCNIDRKITVPYCINMSCKKAKTEADPLNMITDDVQTILMQEFMEESKNSSPVIMTGKLTGYNVRTSFVGQRKRITGLFRSNLDLKKNENDIFIDILCLDDLEENKPILPSEEDIKKYNSLLKEDTLTDKLVSSFAPNIFGYGAIKLSIMLELLGGVRTNKRGDINILLVGDPSMAKSELLKFSKKITQKSIYTSGRGSSAAGLTIGMVKMDDGRMIAQAGVLPICDMGFAFIDEFDKMNKEDRSSMHEAMEQQTVSIAKSGIQLTLPTRTSILAAANPKYGVYDSQISLIDNIDIPAPLLSRFDLIWLIKDKIHQTEDMEKATHILDSFTTNDQESFFNERELMTFINYARTFTPSLKNEAKSKLLEIYERMRKASSQSQMPVGTRQLEALVRLSMAYAKLNLRSEVTVEDILSVEKLINNMYEAFGLSLEGNNIQQQIYFDNKNNKQHDAITIWNSCMNEDKTVSLREFELELIASGMTENSSKHLIDRWEKNNVIKLKKNGRYERIG